MGKNVSDIEGKETRKLSKEIRIFERIGTQTESRVRVAVFVE